MKVCEKEVRAIMGQETEKVLKEGRGGLLDRKFVKLSSVLISREAQLTKSFYINGLVVSLDFEKAVIYQQLIQKRLPNGPASVPNQASAASQGSFLSRFVDSKGLFLNRNQGPKTPAGGPPAGDFPWEGGGSVYIMA